MLIIILIVLVNNDNIEHYDARYTNMSVGKCATFCQGISGCAGFGYNRQKSVCYPSKQPISGWPIDSIFRNEYSYDNVTCNKLKPIEEPNDKPLFQDRRTNSIYVCSDGYGKHPKYYLLKDNNFRDIGDGARIDNIFDVQEYSVKKFMWPNDQYDYDQSDLLNKEKEAQYYLPNNITNLTPGKPIPKMFS